MRTVTHDVGTRPDGIRIVRNYFIHDDNTNYLVQAHSYFTKQERKEARLNHKLNIPKQ